MGIEGKTIRNFITFLSLFHSTPEVLVIPIVPYSINHFTKAKPTVNCREHYKSHARTHTHIYIYI
jgi:hypothetical protein